MKARRIGIDAAMIETAGSAVPNIFRSTVVAVTLSGSASDNIRNGRLTTTIRDVFKGDDLQERNDARTREMVRRCR
jgi:hypothetical protein